MGSRNIRMSIFSRIHRIRPRKTKYPTYKNLTVTTTRVIILNFQCVLRSSVCRLFVQLICLTKTTNAYTFTFQFSSYVLLKFIIYGKKFCTFFAIFRHFVKNLFPGVFRGMFSLLRQILSSNSITIGICPYGV